jgi:hypothetical protein
MILKASVEELSPTGIKQGIAPIFYDCRRFYNGLQLEIVCQFFYSADAENF